MSDLREPLPCDDRKDGRCVRFGISAHQPWCLLCETKPAYRKAWEEGRGPGQGEFAGPTDKPLPTNGGPGTELHRLLKRLGIHETPDCPCMAHMNTMDSRGAEWCEEHIDTIIGWLKREAKRRKLPFVPVVAKLVVNLAIRRAKKKVHTAEVA